LSCLSKRKNRQDQNPVFRSWGATSHARCRQRTLSVWKGSAHLKKFIDHPSNTPTYDTSISILENSIIEA
ncbi:hypothetical protein, partial [Thiolapillus sp.]